MKIIKILLFLISLASTVISLVGLLEFGYNIIDWITLDTVDRDIMITNFLMMFIGSIVRRISLGFCNALDEDSK